MTGIPLRLDRDAVHLAAPSRVVTVPGFGGDYRRYLETHCTPGDPGRLVAIFTSDADWPAWEVHPGGDELVVVLSGRAEFIQDFGGELRRTVAGPNEAIVNPAGVPHTANALGPFTALYVTPAPGTEHRPRSGNRTDRGGTP